MDFNAKIQETSFQKSLEQGSVFRLRGNEPFESTSFHVFIVLNYDPQSGEALLLVNGTTQIEKRLRNLIRIGINVNETTVRIAPGKYNFFPKETMIDCNEVHEVRITQRHFIEKNLQLMSEKIGEDDLQKMIKAVMMSKKVAESQKKRIHGCE